MHSPPSRRDSLERCFQSRRCGTRIGRWRQLCALWNPQKCLEQSRFGGHQGEVWGLAFSPAQKLLATGGVDRTLRILDFTDPSRLTASGEPLTGHAGTIASIAYSADGRYIVTGSLDHTTRLWDAEIRTGVTTRLDERPVWWVAFSPDGSTIGSAGLDRCGPQKLPAIGFLLPSLEIVVTAKGSGQMRFWRRSAARKADMFSRRSTYRDKAEIKSEVP